MHCLYERGNETDRRKRNRKWLWHWKSEGGWQDVSWFDSVSSAEDI